MRFYLLYFAFLIGCATKPPIPNEISRQCGKGFCLYQTRGDKGSIIYFPGFLDTKRTLETGFFDTSDIDTLMQRLAVKDTLIVSKATIEDPAWFLKSNQEFLSIVNSASKSYAPKRPFLCVGHSMGGFNLLELALLNPDFCDKVVLVNPLIIKSSIDPFGFNLDGAALLIASNFSKKEWARLNPQVLVTKATKSPKIMFSSCKTDIFKFQPATIEVFTAMKQKGFDVEFVDQGPSCDHTTFPLEPIYNFLKDK